MELVTIPNWIEFKKINGPHENQPYIEIRKKKVDLMIKTLFGGVKS